MDILSQIIQLRDYVSGFLITFVECEGKMQGTRMDLVSELIHTAGQARVTIAGGITTTGEIATLDRLGADAQVGMALYTHSLDLAEAFTAPLRSDRPDQLWSTVVVDLHDRALGFCYSNLESITAAINEGRGIYWSRTRGLWRKGESSGNGQTLISITPDCDRDCIRFKVLQDGQGFCHQLTRSCWGDLNGIYQLFERIQGRSLSAPKGSYTRRLFDDPTLLDEKIREEAEELIDTNNPSDTEWEVADLLYFSLVKLASQGGSLSAVEQMLNQRSLAVTRRAGNVKKGESNASV